MSLTIQIYIPVDEDDEYDTMTQTLSESKDFTYLEEVLWLNITHNLTRMASEAGIYQVLWRPGYTFTKITPDVVLTLQDGLEKLKGDPERYKKFDAPNGWGVWEHFVPFVEEVLEGCEKYPNGYLFRGV